MMITLESLFLKGKKVAASSGTIISVACSVLIGKTRSERDRSRQDILHAYALRNNIVHGADIERVKIDPKKQANSNLLQQTNISLKIT